MRSRFIVNENKVFRDDINPIQTKDLTKKINKYQRDNRVKIQAKQEEGMLLLEDTLDKLRTASHFDKIKKFNDALQEKERAVEMRHPGFGRCNSLASRMTKKDVLK